MNIRLLIILFCFGFGSFSAFSQYTDWENRARISIQSQQLNTELQDFPLILELPLADWIADGLLQANAEDLRIAFDCLGLNPTEFYIEEDQLAANLTPVHIRIPNLQSLEQLEFFVFYNNPIATSESDFSAVYPNAIQLLTQTDADNYSVVNTVTDWFEIADGITWSPKGLGKISIDSEIFRLGDGSIIDLDSAGFSPSDLSMNGNGPGAGEGAFNLPITTPGAGAGYGGKGGDGAGTDPAVTKGGTKYGDSLTQTIQLGSSGGSSNMLAGGAGGGAIEINTIYSQFERNSIITCNGSTGESQAGIASGGSGSGGGVIITSPSIQIDPSSTIQSNGMDGAGLGLNQGGASAGGRIKLFGTDLAQVDITSLSATSGAQPVAADAGTITLDTFHSDTLPITLIEEIAEPSYAILASSSEVCIGSPVSFELKSFGFNASEFSVEWFVNDLVLPNETQPNFSIDSITEPVEVYAQITNTNNGCNLTPGSIKTNSQYVGISESPNLSVGLDQNTINICDGSLVIPEAITNGFGLEPRFEWRLDGTLLSGENQRTVKLENLTGGELIEVSAFSNDLCNSGEQITSLQFPIVVSNNITPSVSISPLSSTYYCPSDEIFFTASGSGIDENAQVDWLIDGVVVQSSSSPYLQASEFIGNSVITVEVTSGLSCSSGNIGSSNATVNQLIPPIDNTVTITPDIGICPGSDIVFEAEVSDSAYITTVIWYQNGIEKQRGSGFEFYAENLQEGDSVYALVNSNFICNPPLLIDISNIVKIEEIELGMFDPIGPLCPQDINGLTEVIRYSGLEIEPTSIQYFGDAIINGNVGEYDPALRNFSPDTVTVIALSTDGCDVADTLIIDYLPALNINLPKDTVVCQDTFFIQLGSNPFVSGGNPIPGPTPYFFTWTAEPRQNNPLTDVTPSVFDQEVVVQSVNFPGPNGSPDDLATSMIFVQVDDDQCSYLDSFMITQLIELRLDLDPDTSVCFGENVQLANSNSVSGGNGSISYFWQPNGDLDSLNNININIQATQDVIYTLQAIDDRGCTDTALRSVEVFDRIILDRPTDTTLCPGDSISFIPQITGGEGLIDALWEPQAAVSDPFTLSTELKPTDSITVYNLLITDQEGCSSEINFSVRLLDTSMSLMLGDSLEICLGESIQLNGQAGITGGTKPYLTNWLPIDGLSSDISANTTASPASSTTYTLFVQDAFGCNTESDIIHVDVLDIPVISLPGGISACITDSIRLGDTNIVTGGTTPYSYDWSPKQGLDAYNIPNPLKIDLFSRNYTLSVTDSNGCSSSAIQFAETNDSPELLTIPDVSSCKGDIAVLGLPNPAFGGKGPYSYQWQPGVAVDDSTESITQIITSDTTIFQLIVVDANGCTDTSEAITFTPLPELVLDLQDTLFACQGDSVLLSTGANLSISKDSLALIQWQDLSGIKNPNEFDAKAKASFTREYYLEVIDFNGCEAEDTTLVIVEPGIDLNISFQKFIGGSFETEVQFTDNSIGYDSIVWFMGNGATLIDPGSSFTFVYSEATDIQVCVQSFNTKNNCEADTCFTIPAWVLTSNSPITEANISIFPNPTQDNISIDSDVEPLAIWLMDINGAKIEELSIGKQSIQHLPNGNYWIEIQLESGVTRKLIQKL